MSSLGDVKAQARRDRINYLIGQALEKGRQEVPVTQLQRTFAKNGWATPRRVLEYIKEAEFIWGKVRLEDGHVFSTEFKPETKQITMTNIVNAEKSKDL